MAWFDGSSSKASRRSNPWARRSSDDRLLEVGDLRVVTPGAHDEEVPAQPVALQPGHRLGLDPLGPARQQDHGERRVEELEQPGDLLDDRVVAAGLEEGRPVPPATLEEVLAAGRVGEHAVDVEDHGRPARAGRAVPGTPRPVPLLDIGLRSRHESPA